MQDRHKIRIDSDEGSSQGERSISYIPECSRRGDCERQLENLGKSVNDLEIELRGLHRRREWDESSFDLDYILGASSRGSGSY